MSTTRVLVVDDHAIVRQGLRRLLENEADLTVVGEAGDGLEAVRLTEELCPDVVLMDIFMPQLNGIEATRVITASTTETRVIALTGQSERQLVQEMLKAGASGFLLKGCDMQELLMAIRAAGDNKMFITPDIAGVVVDTFIQQSQDTSHAFATLAPKERQILQLLAEGYSSKEIASALDISVKTVEAKRSLIMEKLNLYSVAELTKYAVREGLTSLH